MWTPFENCATIGEKGSEGGEIILDEEHSLGARITLEKNPNVAPFTITCGIYGWMVHTRFFRAEDEATAEYDKMKSAIVQIIEPFSDPSYDDYKSTQKEIESFVETFP